MDIYKQDWTTEAEDLRWVAESRASFKRTILSALKEITKDFEEEEDLVGGFWQLRQEVDDLSQVLYTRSLEDKKGE